MNRRLNQIESLLARLLDPHERSGLRDPGEDVFHRNDSEDYLYVSVDLPDRVGPDIDISWHEVVCQIRIQK